MTTNPSPWLTGPRSGTAAASGSGRPAHRDGRGCWSEIDVRVAELFAAMEAAANLDPAARAVFETSNDQRREGARVIVDGDRLTRWTVRRAASLRGRRHRVVAQRSGALPPDGRCPRVVGRPASAPGSPRCCGTSCSMPTAPATAVPIGSLRWWELRRGSTARPRRTFRCPTSTWVRGTSGRSDDDFRDGAFATLRREAPISFFEAAMLEGYEPVAGHWALTTLRRRAFRQPPSGHLQLGPSITIGDSIPELAGVLRVDDRDGRPAPSAAAQHRQQGLHAQGGGPHRGVRCVNGPVGWSTEMIANHPDGKGDVVAELAGPLPLQVICDMMGIPEEDHQTDLPLDQRHPRLRRPGPDHRLRRVRQGRDGNRCLCARHWPTTGAPARATT